MNEKIKSLLDSLTLFEKASLCSGLDFWKTKPIKRLNVPSIAMSDGPHGLRKENNDDVDNVAMKASFPATSFPPAVNLASTWNPELIRDVGKALAEQCLNQDVQVILGPGTNIKRSPLCGRNFEYLSEDPYLAGKMCVEYIQGVENMGVGTSLKHFAVNSQEYLRMTINEVVDERSFRELYAPAFEMAVKDGKPGTVMCSYNRINGTYASDNKKLLTDILRTEWGYEGLVVSDWNAVNNRVLGVRAGMDLEMPSSGGRTDKEIVKAVVSGDLLESELNLVVSRILEMVFKYHEARDEGYFYNYREGHMLARKVARESIVLMKNDDNILPFDSTDDVAVIGELAKTSRYQGAGSSRINPYQLVSFIDHLEKHKRRFCFAPGYNLSNDGYDEQLFKSAIELAASRDKVLLFVGLTDSYESESYDRRHMSLPASHIKLIEEITKVNPNVTIVLFGGSPVEMPWLDSVKCLLNAYLPGEAGGEALSDVIFGDTNPSGKLAETYPIKLDDFLGSQYYKGGPNTVEHREGIFIGYRYYDTAEKEVLFPFGHGLSYTTFEYSNIKLSSDSIKDTDTLAVTFDVKNTGDCVGAETAQLYISDCESTIFRPTKELKGFKKVTLQPQETATITITLDKRSFAYYDTVINDWYVESGSFKIQVGSSSRDIRLSTTVEVTSTNTDYQPEDLSEIMPSYYNLVTTQSIPDEEYAALLGTALPDNSPSKRGEFDMNTTIGEMRCCVVGKVFMRIAPAIIKGEMPDADMTTMLMLQQGMEEMPLRALNGVTSGLLEQEFLEGMLLWGNRKRLKGLLHMIKGLLRSLKNLSNNKASGTRVKQERKKYKEELQAIKLEQKQALQDQKAMLDDLKSNFDELKKIRKAVYNESDIDADDATTQKTLDILAKHEEKIAQLKKDIENTKESNKENFEEFKARKKDELRQIKEEEKQISEAIKQYLEDIEAEDSKKALSNSNSDYNSVKSVLYALTHKKKSTDDSDKQDDADQQGNNDK